MDRPFETSQTNIPFVRPRHEVADIIRKYGDDYRANHSLPLHVRRVLNAIQNCRTAALGGHVEQCTDCGALEISYNSCRDRHCPKCQGLDRAHWMEERMDELLPVPYFHTVFTLPHEINIWASWNEGIIYDLLFKTAEETLQEFAARYWNGELGFTAALHTWGQAQEHHIHLHCIVPGGALGFDGQTFKRCPHRDWLFPIVELSRFFREKYLGGLQRLHENGKLVTPPGKDFGTLREELRKHDWVVYAKPPIAGGPETVIKYLSRYTHSVAISNSRILDISGGQITFTWKDYKDDSKIKEMILPADEFIRRFITHILPPRYHRIRHFGLLAGGGRAKLNHVRELLSLPPLARAEREPYDEFLLRLTGKDIHVCSHCGGHLQHYRDLLPNEPFSCHDPPIFQKAA